MYKKLYPLKFNPIEVERVWGGESWILASMDETSDSEISGGFLQGNNLGDVLETYMGDLVGDSVFEYYGLQFPLLVKMLKVEGRLSVQVHPDDETAMERYWQYGKSECWHIVDAKPGAAVWMGFKRDVTASEFYEACRRGTAQELMNEYHPAPGESFFIPAGTVHACGGGLTIAEVQEPSDLTFRLYDWGRENNPATARQMHLDEALDCIDFQKYEEPLFHHSGEGVIADCNRFTASILKPVAPFTVSVDESENCLTWVCVGGSADFDSGTGPVIVSKGQAILIPARLDEVRVTPGRDCVLMKTFIRKIDIPDGYINPDVPAELPEDGTGKN